MSLVTFVKLFLQELYFPYLFMCLATFVKLFLLELSAPYLFMPTAMFVKLSARVIFSLSFQPVDGFWKLIWHDTDFNQSENAENKIGKVIVECPLWQQNRSLNYINFALSKDLHKHVSKCSFNQTFPQNIKFANIYVVCF